MPSHWTCLQRFIKSSNYDNLITDEKMYTYATYQEGQKAGTKVRKQQLAVGMLALRGCSSPRVAAYRTATIEVCDMRDICTMNACITGMNCY